MRTEAVLGDIFGDAPYRKLVEAIRDFAVLHLDREGRIVSWNAGATALFGYGETEMVGKPYASIFTNEDQQSGVPERELKEVVETGRAEDTRWHPRRDGTSFYANCVITALLDENGSLCGFAKVARDDTTRKQIELALNASEVRYRRLFEAAHDGILILNAETGQIADVNPFVCELLDYPKAEFVGKELWEIGLFKDKDESQAAFRELQETGYIRYEDMPLETKDGVRREVEFISNVYREGDQQVIQCNIRDITERKRQEQALRESENKYRLLIEQASDGIHTYDMQGNFIETNSKFCEMLGYTPEELLRLNVKDLIPAEDLAVDPIRFDKLRAGKTLLKERRLRRKDGAHIPVEISGRMIQDNVLQAIIRDISKRKQAEEELNASEERLRTIFEASRDGILVEDDERIVYVNQSYTHLLGYDAPEELIGKHISSVISSEDTERLLEFGKSRVRGELPASVYEFKGKRKDGTLIEGEASVSASFVAGHVYITSIVRDITERKRAQESLRISQAELQRSNDELERRVVERTAALSETNDVLQEEVRARRRIEAERIELLRRVIFAQEDERRRIAREMHDQFGQGLSALTLKLAALKEESGEQVKLREQLEKLEAVTNQLDSDVDFLVWELRPTVLDDLGLPAALKAHVQNWSNHFGIPAELHVSGMKHERLTGEIETVLYRITQEALNNIAKHARAGKVDVILEHREHHVSLIIEDDGVGFDGAQAFSPNDKGLGLIGMRERAALVGGTADIESHPNDGTTIFIRIPVPREGVQGE